MKEENRRRKNLNNKIDIWWLRSADIYYSGSVACVNIYGYVDSNYYSDENGVVPAFII